MLALTLVLLALPAFAAEAPLLEVISRREILSASFIPVTHAPTTFPLTLVVEAGSPWTAPGTLERAAGKTSAILARCGVALSRADVVVVRWSPEALRRLNVANPYLGPPQTAVMDEALLPGGRPVGFLFAAGSVPTTAQAYNASTVARYRASHPAVAKLLRTFWITHDYELRRAPDVGPSFSVIAHELVHILGDLGHTPATPNLMTDDESRGAKTGDLNDEQCAAIRQLRSL